VLSWELKRIAVRNPWFTVRGFTDRLKLVGDEGQRF
jgi:hypothetical protein